MIAWVFLEKNEKLRNETYPDATNTRRSILTYGADVAIILIFLDEYNEHFFF